MTILTGCSLFCSHSLRMKCQMFAGSSLQKIQRFSSFLFLYTYKLNILGFWTVDWRHLKTTSWFVFFSMMWCYEWINQDSQQINQEGKQSLVEVLMFSFFLSNTQTQNCLQSSIVTECIFVWQGSHIHQWYAKITYRSN